MKTIFAVIGFSVCCLWAWHYAGNSVIKSAVNMVWNVSAPYLNDAVNKAQK